MIVDELIQHFPRLAPLFTGAKTYAPARPLFGRFTGTYYWQAHLAGRDAAHRVEKSYEVVAP